MAGLDRTGKNQSNNRASKFRQILNFVPQEDTDELEERKGDQQSIPLAAIQLPLYQPRRYFDPQKLEQLAASIKEHGVLENLLVRPLPGEPKQYELIAGERRYRAAAMVGLESVPATVRELTVQQALEIALVENLQREDLNPVEETEGILHLLSVQLGIEVKEVPSLLYRMQHEAKGRTAQNVLGSVEGQAVQNVFQALGLISWESFASSRLPLLKLPQEVLEAIRQGKVEYTKAQAVARVKDASQRAALLENVIQKDLSLSQIREHVKALTFETDKEAPKAKLDDLYRRVTKAKLWEDPKKWKQAQVLLAKLAALVEEE